MSEKDEYEAAFKEEVAKESKRPITKKVDVVPPIPTVVASAPVSSAAPAKFTVVESKMISWRGSLTLLRKGKILSEAHYGKDGLEHLTKQGVKLELVK